MKKYLYAVKTCNNLKDMCRLLRVQSMALNKELFLLAQQGFLSETEGGQYELSERGVYELGDFVFVYERPSSELPFHIAPVPVSGGYAVKVGNYIIPTPISITSIEAATVAAKRVASLCKNGSLSRITPKHINQLSEIMSEALGDLVTFVREQ